MVLPYSNLQLKHQNPGAQHPLVLPIHVVCNTSDEQIHANIRANARRRNAVLKAQDPHDGVAILCGSGPSLADSLDAIRQWRGDARANIFAMNGAASYLAANGIMPDYQVMIDARQETADLVGPAHSHLFASQVHPDCFAKAPYAVVWHLQIEGIDDLLPDGYQEHTQIGGAASVGNTATCLAYAMGYRNLQIYGYDSSHRNGNGHAFRQPMNDGDPCAWVTFGGKDYLTSLTMKLQAEKFQQTARELKQLGVTINVHGDGLLPDIFNAPQETLSEHEKYTRMWAMPQYHQFSYGERSVRTFLDLAKINGTGPVIDFGCGTGRAGLAIEKSGLDVMLVDFVATSRDQEALGLPFLEWDLTKPCPLRAPYGFCCDVMEHIPTADILTVLSNIRASVNECFFQISTIPDALGALINQDLHLTVKPGDWWMEQMKLAGWSIDYYRPMDGEVQLYVRSTS